MNLKLIEPLKEFFKDEVRVLGNSLGLSNDICNRHPFPGFSNKNNRKHNTLKKLKFFKKLIISLLMN